MASRTEQTAVKTAIKNDVDIYTRLIGERIRGLRSQRSMTRKDLSRDADISERYLSQIESGTANMTIGMLWRIAEAMDVVLGDLLPDGPKNRIQLVPLYEFLSELPLSRQKAAYDHLLRNFADIPGSRCGIALIGLRGAGKTTLGKLLGNELGIPFIRLRDVIEETASMKIKEIFSLGGQKTYRRLEKKALDYVIENHENIILEVGGSLVSEKESYNLLLSTFYTVWLRARPEDHMQRVIDQGDIRPIAGDTDDAMEDLKAILAEREPYYQAANFILETSDASVNDCLERLVKKINAEKLILSSL